MHTIISKHGVKKSKSAEIYNSHTRDGIKTNTFGGFPDIGFHSKIKVLLIENADNCIIIHNHLSKM